MPLSLRDIKFLAGKDSGLSNSELAKEKSIPLRTVNYLSRKILDTQCQKKTSLPKIF